MQSKLFVLLISILFTCANSYAQDNKVSKNGAKTRELKEMNSNDMKLKSEAASDKQRAIQTAKSEAISRGAGAFNAPSDLKLSADEEKRNINGYKVDFASNPYGVADNAVISISLYNGLGTNQAKVGVINFYSKGAKALSERKALDDKKFITLNYDLDSFAIMKDILANGGNHLTLVHNNKTKEAYISTDVVATRTK